MKFAWQDFEGLGQSMEDGKHGKEFTNRIEKYGVVSWKSLYIVMYTTMFISNLIRMFPVCLLAVKSRCFLYLLTLASSLPKSSTSTVVLKKVVHQVSFE